MDDDILRALDTLMVRFPYDAQLVLATVRCILRLLSVPELCDQYVKIEGVAHIFAVMKSHKDLEVLEAVLKVIDILLHKDVLYLQKLLIEYCDSMLIAIHACKENSTLLTYIAKLLCAVCRDIHDKLVVYMDDICEAACFFAKDK